MDRRIDERLRKPRRTKGTPFYIQRNFWAAGVILLGGFSWYLLDTSKNSASKVESLSQFLLKKPAQAEMPPKIHRDPIETLEEPARDKMDKFLNSESPYKNLIKTRTEIILNDSTNDAADFKSPVPIRKAKNVTSNSDKVAVKKNNLKGRVSIQKNQSKRGRPKSSKQNSTIKLITDSFKYFGENPEHMQMAIALSKSSYENECGSNSQSSPKEDVIDIGDILRNSKPSFLERFGFTSDRKILPVTNKRTTVLTEVTRKTKNRFKYITPILSIRTNEERNSLIDSKISVILCQNTSEPKNPYEHAINSIMLKNYISKERSIFNLDSIYQKNYFYVKCLEIPQSTTKKCGYLLKDWNLIPGRDKSPCAVKNYSTEEELTSDRTEITELCISYTKIIGDAKETIEETTSSDVTFQTRTTNEEYPSCEKSPVKNVSERLSFGASRSFNVLTDMKKTELKLFNSNSENSAASNSGTSLAKLAVHSYGFNRSISPDLFNSDDETDQKYPEVITNNIPDNSSRPSTDIQTKYSFFCTKENIDYSFNNNAKQRGDCFKDGQTKSVSSLEKNVEVVLSNEIIDLTDDDESENKSNNKSLLSDSKIIAEDSDFHVSLSSKNHIKKKCSTPNANYYNLDDFESDAYNCMRSGSENKEKLEDVISEPYNDFHSLNNEASNSQATKCQSNDVVASKNNQEKLCNNTVETLHMSVDVDKPRLAEHNVTTDNNSSLNNISIVNVDDFNFKNNNKINFVNNSLNKSEINHSACISDINKTDANAFSDSSPNLHILSSYSKKEENETNQDSFLNDTPKRNLAHKRMALFYNEVSSSDSDDYCKTGRNSKGNDCLSMSEAKLTVGETPKKCFKSPCFDGSILHNSTDLNVTDYVNNILNQDNFSFDKRRENDIELKGDELEIVQKDEETSLSQCSHISSILDEELNYSSHFATPARVSDENKTKYYDNKIEKLDNVLPPSPELQNHICLGIPTSKNISDIDPEIVPKTTVTEQISTPNNFIIKTDNVTPMPEYDKMSTPLINKELLKVGVKPLKRTRGAKLLKYIYDSTHPFVEPNKTVPNISEDDEDKRIIKRRKNDCTGQRPNNFECFSSIPDSFISANLSVYAPPVEIIGDRIMENEKLEDLIFERKQLTKIASCKVPLQIVWHNLVSSHKAIRENILLYEPLQLESLHMMLKDQGFKFHIQDVLTFLDKKCITIRTAQKQGRANT